MKHTINTILTIFMTMTFLNVNSQTDNFKVDTFKIYKNKSGVGYKKYRWTWYSSSRRSHTTTYRLNKINMQDSLVLGMLDLKNQITERYLKIYNSKNKLILEGKTEDQEMIGDIKYYYKSGQIKRIEHLGKLDSFDGINKTGVWKYYRKDGTLKKQKDYIGYEYFKKIKYSKKKLQ